MGALITTAELSMLRTVQNVVRLGRVTAVRATSLELEKGAMPLAPGTLLVEHLQRRQLQGRLRRVRTRAHQTECDARNV